MDLGRTPDCNELAFLKGPALFDVRHCSKQRAEMPYSWMLLLGSVEGQVGWGSEQLGLLEVVPAHGRGVGSLRSLLTGTIL